MRIQYRYIDNAEGHWPEIRGEVRAEYTLCYNPSSTTEERIKDQIKHRLEREVYNGLSGRLVTLKTLIMRNFMPLGYDSIQVLENEFSSLFDSLRLEE